MDAAVLIPTQVDPGAVIRSRPIRMLRMEDENGPNEKIDCAPHERVPPQYAHVDSLDEPPHITFVEIEYFFERYNDP